MIHYFLNHYLYLHHYVYNILFVGIFEENETLPAIRREGHADRELGGIAPRVRPEGVRKAPQVVARAMMREKCTEKSRIISGERDEVKAG